MSQWFDDWLPAYVEGRLKAGAVEEDAFTVFLDPQTNRLNVVEPFQVQEPTATFYIEEATAWVIAGRGETCYTAWLSGLPIYIEGEFMVRDTELVDEILALFYELSLTSGHDVAALFRD